MELQGKTKLELILDQIDVSSLSEKMKHRIKTGQKRNYPAPYSLGFKVIGDVQGETTFCRY